MRVNSATIRSLFDNVADTEYLVCHTIAESDKSKSSNASYTLMVNQWKADGTVCQTDSSTSVTLDTPYYVHHVVPLKWNSGETGAVQGMASNLTGGCGSAGRHNSDMSAIYVIPKSDLKAGLPFSGRPATTSHDTPAARTCAGQFVILCSSSRAATSCYLPHSTCMLPRVSTDRGLSGGTRERLGAPP